MSIIIKALDRLDDDVIIRVDHLEEDLAMTDTHLTAPTRFIEVEGARFAYRRWGNPSGVPLFFIQHFRGGMDHWDP